MLDLVEVHTEQGKIAFHPDRINLRVSFKLDFLMILIALGYFKYFVRTELCVLVDVLVDILVCNVSSFALLLSLKFCFWPFFVTWHHSKKKKKNNII